MQAYYESIDNYLDIENHFFFKILDRRRKKQCKHSISDIVQNAIAYHIRKRIEKAYTNKEKFRVFVPLLTGFVGEPEESSTLQIILKHMYVGICNNHGLSLIGQIYKIIHNEWKNYIGFYSLFFEKSYNNK